MMRWLVLSLAALAWVGVALADQGPGPTLRAAASSGGHIVVAFSAAEFVPGEIAVATQATRTTNGGFVRANVKLSERITARPDAASGMVRFRTHGRVPLGVYYVVVSGVVQEPPVGCVPIRSRCAERWSNVLRVVVAH